MKNPIRDAADHQRKIGSLTFGADTLEQWADEFDKLLNPWVSVDTKRPGSAFDCLVVINGSIQETWYRFESGIWYRSGDNGVYSRSAFSDCVSHWMPIPPLPGVEE